ncbi:MAG TPA: response regulator [Gemmatimonadales bacterium]|nr:response regulator [Gemmatimonadales bacterium]
MSETGPMVLLIEDEVPMRRFLRAALASESYRLIEAATARDGLAEAASRNPDLILLDLGLPDADGIEVTRRLREWNTRPIIVLSARGQERDKIDALDAGADDYLTKPFSVPELLARMRVALRHAARGSAAPEEPVFTTGALSIDRGRRVVTVRGEEVHLTPTEYRLLLALAQHAGRVLTHRQLLREVWGPGRIGQDHYLRVYMAQLRAKIEKDPARPEYLRTEPGVGYRMTEAE